MKIVLSVFLVVVLLTAVCMPTAFASDNTELAVHSVWFNDASVLYLCMDKAIRDITDDFAVALLLYGDTNDPDNMTNTQPIEPVNVQWILPDPETNGFLELWLTLPETVDRGKYAHFTVSGLLDANGETVKRAGREYMDVRLLFV